jgi:Skp family chaperone for outer membrane proteins
MRKTFLAAAVACAVAASTLAQEPAGAVRNPKIAVIDLGRISSESALGKSYASQIEKLENEIKAEGAKKQTELQKQDGAIKALADELEKQASVLSPEARDRKEQEILKKRRERDAYLEDGQRELTRMRERAQAQAEALNNDFQAKIRPHIEAAAREKGVDIILNSQIALTVNKDFDISQTVIAKADAAAPAAARPAAAAPAAKPTPTPAPSPQQ